MENKFIIDYNYISEPLNLADFYVFQFGRVICGANTLCTNHYHSNWYELTIVTQGEGVLYTNNKPVRIQSGDIYLSCVHDIHAIESSENNPLQYDCCSFFPKDEGLQRDFEELTLLLTDEKSRLFHSNRISTLCPLAINEVQDLNKAYSPTILNSILWQISTYTLRVLKKINSYDNTSIKDKNILCYQIMDYINSHIESMRSLSELTEAFHYSYNYLSTTFKETTSTTLIEFYNMQRLNIAKTMILENKLTLEEIADKTNFSTSFALSKAFKKNFLLSPVQYRKENMQNK